MFSPRDFAGQAGLTDWERFNGPPDPSIPASVSNSGGAVTSTGFDNRVNTVHPTDSRFAVQIYNPGYGVLDSNDYYICTKYDQWFGIETGKLLAIMRLNSPDALVEGDIIWAESYGVTHYSPSPDDDGFLLLHPLATQTTSEITFEDDVTPTPDSVTSSLMVLKDSVVTNVGGAAVYQINTAAPAVPLGLISNQPQYIGGQKTFATDVVVNTADVYVQPPANPSDAGCLVAAAGNIIAIGPYSGGPQIYWQDYSGNASSAGYASLLHFNKTEALGGGANGTQLAICDVFDAQWNEGNVASVGWQLISNTNIPQFSFYVFGGYEAGGSSYAVQDTLGNMQNGITTTVSYEKAGGGTGTLTFNGGILTASS